MDLDLGSLGGVIGKDGTFGILSDLLGNIKGVFDFTAGVTGSLSGFEGDKGPVVLFETLFAGSSDAA